MSGYRAAIVTGLVTKFTDTFNRINGEVGLNWGLDNLGGNLIGHWHIGACSDGPQGMILDTFGAMPKSDAMGWSAPLANVKVFGLDQFCQFDLISEVGVSSFCGPAVAVQCAAFLTCYAVILRNGQWRLSRFLGGVNTDLIAAAALAIPCTLKISVHFNGAISNTVTVFRNGVQIGTFVDSSAVIQATGIPGFYVGAPSIGDSSQWRNFSGGKS